MRRAPMTWAKRLASNDLTDAFAAADEIAAGESLDVAIPWLARCLADPHPLVATHARFVLRDLGDPALGRLLDFYDEHPTSRSMLADFFGFLGPRAGVAAGERLRRDGHTVALKQVVGPWEPRPREPLPYLGESVRLDWDGPPPIEALGKGLWLDLVERQAEYARNDGRNVWNRLEWQPGQVQVDWCPDHIAIDQREFAVNLYDFESEKVVTTMVRTEGVAFSKQALLWALLEAQHRLGRCNDRIFEGLALDDEGAYYLSTGS